VARFTDARVEKLLGDARIVRNRAKVTSVVDNARALLRLERERAAEDKGDFADYLWSFVDGVPIQHRRRRITDLPAKTDLSAALSKDLKRRGFRFVGPTTMYALMQAMGMVNDHTVDCFRHAELAARPPG